MNDMFIGFGAKFKFTTLIMAHLIFEFSVSKKCFVRVFLLENFAVTRTYNAGTKKISVRQMELLLEFAESHQDIALGRFPAGPLGNQAARREWESIAIRLNSVAEGTIKTADQWRRYWIEYKAKTKTKAADYRRYTSRTGGGPNKLVPLNALEERVLALIGPVSVEGLPSVRLPINVPPVETQFPDSAPSFYSSPPLQLQCSSETYASQESIETTWLQVSDSQTPSNLMEIFVEPSQPSQSITPPESSVQAEQGFERVEVEAQPEAPQPPLVPQPQPEESQSEEPHPGPLQPSRGTQQRRALRRNRLQEGVPRWAYDLKTRRIAVEERNAHTLARFLAVAERMADSHEAMASDIRQIRENMK